MHGTVTCLSHRSGDVDAGAEAGAATGLFVDDRRVLDLLSLTVDDVAPVPVVAATAGPSTECLLLARNVGDPGPDPTVEVRRHRVLRDTGMTETVTVTSRAATEVRCVVLLRARGDGAELHTVKSGRTAGPTLPARHARPGPRRVGRRASHHHRRRARRHGGRRGGHPVRAVGGRHPTGGVRHAGPRRVRAARGAHTVRRRAGGRPGRLGCRAGHLAGLPAVRHGAPFAGRPAAPAAHRPPRRGRRLRGRGLPLVPHALRPRLDLGGADVAAVRHRAGPGHAAGTGPPAGHPHRRGLGAAARQDPARGAPHRVRGPRQLRPAHDVLRHRRRHPAVGLSAARRLALGAATRRRA